MCGIAGFIDLNGESGLEDLTCMTNSLSYRGPDDFGYKVWKNNFATVGFGHRRLSIIDLSANGHQPMSIDGALHIVFNGEIYNYKEIKSELLQKGCQFNSGSDTEVILHAYRIWGIDMILHFTGMFSIAIYDVANSKVFFIRDRAGVKPFYYFWKDKIFLFGSELKAFHTHPSFPKNINEESIRTYMQYGYIPAPNSIFLDTYKLMPGHYLVFDLSSGDFKKIKYWDVAEYYHKPTIKISKEDALAETERLIQKACSYRMVSDVPVGVFLSGGYDSTLVAALIQKQSGSKIKTFTIGFEDQRYNEALFAKQVADHIGTDHYERYCTTEEAKSIIPTLAYFFDEPFGDSSAIPTILVSKFAKEHVTVSLSADGGDEIFGGYNKYQGVLSIKNKIDKIPELLRNPVASLLKQSPSFLLKYVAGLQDSSYENREKIARYIKYNYSAVQIMDEVNSSGPAKRIDRFLTAEKPLQKDYFGLAEWRHDKDFLKAMLAVDYVSYLPNDILTKIDRATMSVSLEGREPLLDQSIVSWAASIPSELKISNGKTKSILKDLTHNYVPPALMNRPKMGFGVPVVEWFRNDLKHLFENFLSDEALAQHSFFNRDEIKVALKEYYSGSNDKFIFLWYIFIFQMWFEKWAK